MPRVSAEHLAARREQILAAARRCFIRDGFHATSMQHVIAEAGLSVGAVYRYFPSKTDLIVAVAEGLARGVTTQMDAIAKRTDLSLEETMAEAVGVVEANAGPDGALRIAVQVWSEAQRDPALAALAKRMYGEILLRYEEIAAAAVARGDLPADADPARVGPALTSLVLGYGLLRLVIGEPDPASYRAGLRPLLDAPVGGE
jgi:AcrR family transcriptional regulator